ncbi:hypothetical protein ACIRPK_24215 [Kitasatospora sp. NPDC101801]|uniref:hypothetical protein n=1 Tax=Kitasatospora sp. NPDC101801 TaxID=3364103 RepID=UPI003830BE7C
MLAETVRSIVEGAPLRVPAGVEFTESVQEEFLAVFLTAARGVSPEDEGRLRKQLHQAGIYAPPCVELPSAAGDPRVGEPVVEEGFHAIHPEQAGWNMERWLLAVPGDGAKDLGQFAATGLQEHLDTSPDAGAELLEQLRASTVTVHFFQQTGFDEDLGTEYFQGVLYSPAVGWVATERPEPQDDGEEPDSLVWTAPTLAALVDAAGEHLSGLRPDAVDGFGCRWVSGYVREAVGVSRVAEV